MATFEQIKKAILDTAGNPVSGVIVQIADDLARAIVELDKPKASDEKPKTPDTRVQKADEKREISDHSV
jgi:hypothetical protein